MLPCSIFALFYFVFEGNFQVQAPPPSRGAYIWRGDLTEGFLRYEFGGLVHGGAFFQNCTVYWYKHCYCIFFPFKRGILANGLKVKLFYISVPDCKCNAADHQGCIMSAVARQVFCLLPVINSRSLKVTVVSLSYKNMFDIR